MDENDLDSFIANIELTAPVDPLESKLTCVECGGLLEEDEDGHYVCPLCNVQATNILQLDDTELHHDEQGRPVYGQRVRLGERKKTRADDYGWAWSVDVAISHVLLAQVRALKEKKLISEQFATAVFNMFRMYWLNFVAPHIRDDYTEAELFPVDTIKRMKLRDIEVLLKVKDKVMVPTVLVNGKNPNKYRMFGKQFHLKSNGHQRQESTKAADDVGFSNVIEDRDDVASECMTIVDADMPEEKKPDANMIPINDLKVIATHCSVQTRNISNNSITILTLNRTLAFLEAVSRLMRQDDPLLAADLIRACNQRLIPFYAASKLLPENMKLNPRDAMSFRKTRPPTPTQLTRTACLLISRVYAKQLPKKIPVPNIDTILERFICDMNLPRAIYTRIEGQVSFKYFRATQPRCFTSSGRQSLPQYDRWAFGVLVIHLKNLFNLSDRQLVAQKRKALDASEGNSGNDYFIFQDWLRQMSLRLELIMRHDPFVLYHPLCDLNLMVPTSQLEKCIDQMIEDRTRADIVIDKNRSLENHEDSRDDLADILFRKFRPPPQIEREFFDLNNLQVSGDIKHPLSDALQRTRRFWIDKLKPTESDVVLKSFASMNLILVDDMPQWPLFETHERASARESREPGLPTWWPAALKMLLSVGAFLCFCEPVDLLNELRAIVKSCRRRDGVRNGLNARNLPLISPIYNGSNTQRNYGHKPASY